MPVVATFTYPTAPTRLERGSTSGPTLNSVRLYSVKGMAGAAPPRPSFVAGPGAAISQAMRPPSHEAAKRGAVRFSTFPPYYQDAGAILNGPKYPIMREYPPVSTR